VDLARQHGAVVPLILNLWTLTLNLAGGGRYADARARVAELLNLTERTGEDVHWLKALNVSGWIVFECGDIESAIELNRRCADHPRTRVEPEILNNAHLNLADAFLSRGDVALASEFLVSVHRLVDDPAVSEWMKWRYTTHLFASLAELALAQGNLHDVDRWANQCLEIATPRNSRKYISRAWRLRGDAALARRQWQDAQAYLDRAVDVAQQIGNPSPLWRAHVSAARLAEHRDDWQAAGQSWKSAQQVINRMTTAIGDAALADRLAALPLVREIEQQLRRAEERSGR